MKNVQRVLALVLGILLLCSSAYAMPPSAVEETKIILPSAEPEQTAESGERLLLPESEESFAEDTADTHTEAELSNAPETEQIAAEKSETLTVLQQRAEHDGISLREAQKILLTEKRDAKRAAYEEAYQLSEIPAMPEAAAAFSEEAATAANETTSNTNSMLSRVACGDAFYIFLKDDGTVVTWGLYNDTSYNITPYDVPEYTTPTQVANLSSVVSVAADREWGFALTSNGEVWRWTGRLTIEEHNEMPSAVRVDGLTDVASIAGGAGGLTALKKDGTVWYAARNTENGELDTPEPVQDASGMPLSGIIEISSGEEHSLALAGDGTVYAWGDNFYGQLGDGTRESRDYAVPIRNYTGAEKIVKVKAAEGYNLLEDEAGVRWAFGKSDDIEGVTYPKHLWMAQPLAEEEIEETFPPVGIKEIARYSHLGLVLGTDGSVWQKGTYTYTLQEEDPEYYPPGMYFMYVYIHDSDWTRTEGLSGTIEIPKTPALTIAASAFNNSQSLAVVDGYLMSAGDNNWGQLGDGTNTASSFPEFVVDYQDYQMDDVKKVSSGYGFNLILTEDGRVWSVGCADNGKLGVGETEHTNKVYPVRGKNGNGFLRDFVDISAGYKHGIAVKKDGSLWAWGHNSVGQLGDDSKISTNVPVRVKGANGEDWMKNVVSAYANASTSMALKSDGTVYMWGNNDKGQLGDGTKTNRKTPVQVKGENGQGYIGNIKQIATAEGCSLALSTDGTVWSWGDNQNGRLGDGTTNNRYYPSKVLKADGSVLDHIESISVGYYFCAAVDEQGAVWTWGRNDYGQLGHGDTEDSYYADPVYEEGKVGRLYGVTAISCGRNYILMSRGADGSILASGYNQYGQFGNGRTGEQTVYPVKAFDSDVYRDMVWLKEYMGNYRTVGTQFTDITLPKTGPNGSSISWNTSNADYLDTNGKVHHPDRYGEDVEVTLTTVVSKDGISDTEIFKAKILQDRTIQPSTDIPIRTLGFEYDQRYPSADSQVTAPDIHGVTVKILDEEKGIYELYIKKEQYRVDESAEKPFFFWSAREGTFLPVDGCSDYSRAQFTVDENARNKKVKVIVGLGDGLGYVDRKVVILQGAAEETGIESRNAALAENAVAQAMNHALTSVESPEACASVIALGLDTSAKMQSFDPGNTKAWMMNAEGLLEAAPDGSVFGIQTSNTAVCDLTDEESAKSALDQISAVYSGESDALNLLNKTAELLHGENVGNRTAVIFVKGIETPEEFEGRMADLAQEGAAVYVMVLGGGYSGSHPNIVNCETELELRLNMSDLYGALSDMVQVQKSRGLLRANEPAPGDLSSDFKPEKHMLTGSDSVFFGRAMASILNIYGCLPIMAEGNGESYNLFSTANRAQNIHRLVTGNTAQIDSAAAAEISSFYQALEGNERWVEAEAVIDRNLRFRFPVLAKDDNGNMAIIGGKTDGVYVDVNGNQLNFQPTRVIDTYQYLLDVSKNAQNITDSVSKTEGFYNKVRFLRPTNGEVIARPCVTNAGGDVTGFVQQNGADVDISIGTEPPSEENGSKTYGVFSTAGYADNTKILMGMETRYSGMMPDIYGGNKLYNVIKYNDLQATQADAWYYVDLFKATNLGITTGDLSDDGTLNFAPQRELTRAELITMLIRSVDVDVSSYESLSEEKAEALYSEIFRPGIQSQWRGILGLPEADTMSKTEYIRYLQTDYMSDADIAWAKTYMNFAYTNDLIGAQQYLGLDYLANSWGAGEEPSQVGSNTGGCNVKVRRDDTAWIICAMYVRNILSVQVPIKIYKYSLDTSCEKNSYWKTDRAFTDINRSYPYCIDEIYQMYMNGIMVGDTEGKFNPGKILTRAEACTAIVRSLFDLDEQLETVLLEFEGYDNVLPFNTGIGRPSAGWPEEYNIYAARSGYYFVGVQGDNLSGNDYSLQRRVENADNTYHFEELTDDFTALYNGFGESVPNYITENMSEGGYIFKRYYIDRKTALKLRNISGNVSRVIIKEPKDGDIAFRSDKDGHFIYASNPEYVGEQHLINRSENSQLLMRLDRLQPGKYTFMGWNNYTSSTIGAFIDILFHANEKTKVNINAIGIERPKISGDWTATQAYANYRKISVGGATSKQVEPGYANVNFTHIFDPQNIDSMNQWFGQDMYNYIFKGLYKYPNLYNADGTEVPFFIIFDFEIEYGSIDLIETAFETRPEISKILNLTAQNAPYVCDTTYKGIDNVSNKTVAKVSYTLDNYTTEYLSMRVFNTHNPMGYETPMWMTNINPQEDYFAHKFWDENFYAVRNIAVESDMLSLEYKDGMKLDCYGANVSEKHESWYFDAYHDKETWPVIKRMNGSEYYTEKAETKSENFCPNNIFEQLFTTKETPELTHFDMGCSMGNYSIETIYEIDLINTSKYDKVVEFRMNNWQNNIIEIFDHSNNSVEIFNTGNGDRYSDELKTNDRLIKSMRVNSGEREKYTVKVILVTGDPGGMKSYLKCYNVSD